MRYCVSKSTLKVILHSSPDPHGEDFEILRDLETKKEEEETRKRKLFESEPKPVSVRKVEKFLTAEVSTRRFGSTSG
ncbi:unnamed protein product [Caenorhabditis auriculariae]|uniref:Uncharacterized protein n=1 Tax=Caenorhabditis auriculariae TaxID=2777116 RepID=A0A8S1GVH6_9PELO|nr:unnamed protein product [Caenorhabditis auriculariae]